MRKWRSGGGAEMERTERVDEEVKGVRGARKREAEKREQSGDHICRV